HPPGAAFAGMNSFLFGRRKAGADPRLHESYAPLSLLKLDAADRAVILVAVELSAAAGFISRLMKLLAQKRTFTRWVNQQLKQKSTRISDLFQDLRNGFALITLLEVLSGHVLPVERGHLRFHYLQNVEIALQFLQFDGARIVNIRPDDIVDGNPKLTLGLVWVIILHYQVVRGIELHIADSPVIDAASEAAICTFIYFTP
uniref:Calponin-homology (CH) domain-containing protein n=1 Tax=Macrostomum lignano TaxID=282301 RepID=A0A1I8IUW0_9PLAT